MVGKGVGEPTYIRVSSVGKEGYREPTCIRVSSVGKEGPTCIRIQRIESLASLPQGNTFGRLLLL